MPKERINFRKILPATFRAVHTTAAGRQGASRWMIFDGADVYRGDLTRWRPEMTWTWQPYSGDLYTQEGAVIEGTLEECLEAVHKLAE